MGRRPSLPERFYPSDSFFALRWFKNSQKPPSLREVQLVDISKLGLNSKIKKFSYSFICGNGYSPPNGENSFLSTVCSSLFEGGLAYQRLYSIL